jgi:hypothetical protein
MPESIVKQIQRESVELRERLDQYRKLLNDVLELRTLDLIGPEVKSRIISAMSPAEISPHLREVALRCQSLARESADSPARRTLQDVGIELADQAVRLDEVFSILGASHSP